jgi:hypothetical protein
MNGEIFFLKESQAQLCQYIYDLINAQIPGIDIARTAIDDQYKINDNYPDSKLMHDCASRYLESFKLAIMTDPARRNFDVSVHEDSDAYYYYLGHDQTEIKTFLSVHQNKLNCLFPAIIIWDRMVMVPHLISKAFQEDQGTFPWCPLPLSNKGTLLVDYQSEEAIKNAITQVFSQLKKELSRICSRYLAFCETEQAAFSELSTLTGVSVRFLEANKHELIYEFTQFSCQVLTNQVTVNKRSHVIIKLQKTTLNSLTSIVVQLRAPANTLHSPVVQYLQFNSQDDNIATLEFDITAKVVPYCPLELIFSLDEQLVDFSPIPMQIILDVIH